MNRPNVLFIFADDYSYEAINALGATEIRTPNLNRLVRNGVTFTHAYNMGPGTGRVWRAGPCSTRAGSCGKPSLEATP